MAAQIIDGFSIAQNVRAGVGEKVKELQAQGVIPCLAVVLVGENPASISYAMYGQSEKSFITYLYPYQLEQQKNPVKMIIFAVVKIYA